MLLSFFFYLPRKKMSLKDFWFMQLFSARGLLLLLHPPFQRKMLKLLTSLPFRVKIHISSHFRREITVFSHLPVPDRKEVKLCFTGKVPFSCGWLWNAWMKCCLWHGFLTELCISGWYLWKIQNSVEIWRKSSFLSSSHPEWWHGSVLLYLFTYFWR